MYEQAWCSIDDGGLKCCQDAEPFNRELKNAV